jgi:hypothetical protein
MGMVAHALGAYACMPPTGTSPDEVRGHPSHTKTKIVVAIVYIVPITIGTPHVPMIIVAVPRTTANHAGRGRTRRPDRL